MASPGRVLFAFDFDHTLVDGNTDTWVWAVPLPGGRRLANEKIRELRKENAVWADFMNHLFRLLRKEGAGRDDILEHMSKWGRAVAIRIHAF